MEDNLTVLQRLYDTSNNLDPFNYEGRQEEANKELSEARKEAKAVLDNAQWQPIETAPYQEVIEVRNQEMDKPVRATRGFQTEKGAHPVLTYCTSIYTPDELFPFPAGRMVCPTEWRPVPDAGTKVR